MDSNDNNQMSEFGYSENFIREGRGRILVFILYISFFALAFSLYLSNLQLIKSLFVAGCALLITGTMMAIEIPLLNLRRRKLKVLIDDDRLIIQCGKKQQIFPWKDITRIKTVEKKNGVVTQIKIYPKRAIMATYIHGFEEMEDMANLIRERTSDNVLHQEKRWKLDWHNPYIGLLVGGLPAMVIMFIIASMGSKAMDIFAVVVALLGGLCLLIIRPLTKLNVFGKWVELFFAIILLGLGVYALIYYFLYGKMP